MGIYIENEGALFRSRGSMTESPEEVYNPGSGWEKYEGDVPKSQGWGESISTKEAEEMMARIDERGKSKRQPA